MMKHILAAATAATMILAVPVQAQSAPPMIGGEYWEVTGIDVADGAGPRYANWLATEWRRFNDFSMEQGWITSYTILSNVHNRHDEPDLYLIRTYASLPDGAEGDRRREAFQAFVRRTNDQLASESGNRAAYRTVMSTSLLQEMKFRD
ncbi:MAG: hypothetical protein HKO13_01025 [Sphingomonas sp.]|nr:hypothetical protein [Sphingomonas sp.]RZV48334.1 MAG: hypothetical protein EX258_08935 [Sphingomonadaceae bacterium]